MQSYATGATIKLFATITDSVTGAKFDPSVVTCVVKPPHDDSFQPVVTKDDIGEYHTEITPAVAGIWTFRFEGTGTSPTAEEAAFFIRPSEV